MLWYKMSQVMSTSEYLVIWQAEKRFAKALLVEIVTDQANGARENKEGVKEFGVN